MALSDATQFLTRLSIVGAGRRLLRWRPDVRLGRRSRDQREDLGAMLHGPGDTGVER